MIEDQTKGISSVDNQTENDLHQQVRDGQAAKERLEDPVLQRVFEELEADYLHTWRMSSAENSALREECYYALNALDVVKLKLKSKLGNGKFASQQLKDHNGE